MSGTFAKETANPVPPNPEAESESATNPADEHDEKHKETSRSPSLHSKSSRPSDGLAPVAAAGNIVDLPSEAQSTLVNTANPSPPPGRTEDRAHRDEKHSHVIETNGSSDTEAPAARDGDIAEPNTENAEQDEIVYPGGLQLGLLTFGLCMATFTVALDNTIIATAIPKITTVFDSLGDVGWYGSSYLLTTTALQPSFGRIYTYFNVKYTYLFALCLFELGSIICAAARNSVMLIVGRAVAGAGASALFSGGEFLTRHGCLLSDDLSRNDYRRLHRTTNKETDVHCRYVKHVWVRISQSSPFPLLCDFASFKSKVLFIKYIIGARRMPWNSWNPLSSKLSTLGEMLTPRFPTASRRSSDRCLEGL